MLTTTEAALVGLLRKGPMSGYDLRKDVERSVGYFWAPAKTQIYATLPKLVEAGSPRRRRSSRRPGPTRRSTSSPTPAERRFANGSKPLPSTRATVETSSC